MRVMFVLPRFHTNMWFATRAMRAAGIEVRVLVNTASRTEDHSIVTPVVMGEYPDYADVAREVRAFAPDVVIVRNAWALSRRAARAARRAGIPRLLYNQIPACHVTTPMRRLQLWWKGLPATRITPVRCQETDEVEPFAQYLPWPVGRLPRETGDIAEKPKEDREDDERLRVLLVGKLGSARKNQDKVIDAIAQSPLTSRLRLTLAGVEPGKENPHSRQIRSLAARDWISLEGHVPFSDMGRLYAAHDVCVLPSFAEPLGTSPVEAMAYGVVPVISSDCGSAGYLTHGEDGFVFDPRRMDALLGHLERLCDDRALCATLKRRAEETARGPLGEDVFIERFKRLMQETVARQGAPGSR